MQGAGTRLAASLAMRVRLTLTAVLATVLRVGLSAALGRRKGGVALVHVRLRVWVVETLGRSLLAHHLHRLEQPSKHGWILLAHINHLLGRQKLLRKRV